MRPGRAIAAAAVAVLVSACGGGAGNGGSGEGAAPLAAECGTVLPTLGQVVYVSTLGTDIDGCGGTTATACQSIKQGIRACSPSGGTRTRTSDCGVLVRHGLYPTTETIALRDGVSVYGSCRFDGEPDRHYRTTILAAAAPGTPAISAVAIKTPTLLRDLVVIGQDETAHGTASLAMVVSGSTGLSVVNTMLSSGRGGDGLDGSVPAPAGAPGNGINGIDGGRGGPSCAANTEAGTGEGGQGGTGWLYVFQRSPYGFDCDVVDKGSAGQPAGGDPAKTRAALGTSGPAGQWCNGRPYNYPVPGVNGAPGAAGACGAATQPSPLTAGSFSGTVWVASRGDNGRPGGVGGGGGGGGAGGSCVNWYTEIYDQGTGGGGGGGGCGGGAGTAGQQGGASIPLVLVDSSLVFDASLNALVPGPGGRGGGAKDAVRGGPGGTAGLGLTMGQTYTWGHWCPAFSAPGGAGGPGGFGSAAAAGHGGPSIGIALVGKSTAPVGLDAVYLPQPGLPGAAGHGGAIFPGGACSLTAGPDGAGGVAGLGAASHEFNVAPTNFLAAGQGLAIGAGRTSLNGTVRLGLDANLDLCLTRGAALLWCSHENQFRSGDELRMQTDGNLCLYKGGALPSCTNTQAHPGSYLVVRDDGHVVVTDGITTFWSKP